MMTRSVSFAKGCIARDWCALLCIALLVSGCDKDPVSATAAGLRVTELVKVSGDEQAASAGAKLPSPLVVRAVDARGKPVEGADVIFSATFGEGSVGLQQQTTDGQGKAILTGWTLGSAPGGNVLEARVAASSVSVNFTASGRSLAVAATPVSVSPGGGVLMPALPGSGMEGLRITVPANAYSSATSFSVSTLEVPVIGGTPPAELVARLRIENGRVEADSLIQVHIPVRSAPGDVISAYWYDASAGSLEPAPVLASDSVSLTIATRTFAWAGTAGAGTSQASAGTRTAQSSTVIQAQEVAASPFDLVITRAREDALLTRDYNTGFNPGTHDWDFTNLGSAITPDGFCFGQTVSMLWHYDMGRGSLYNRYAPARRSEGSLGLDNARGVRLAALVQQGGTYDAQANEYLKAAFSVFDDRRGNYLRLLDAFRRNPEQPQLFILKDGNNAHAVVAFAAAKDGTISVADPNYPGQTRPLKFSGQSYELYLGSLTAGGNQIYYTNILFVPRSILTSKIREATRRWRDFDEAQRTDPSTGAAPLGQAEFPAYSLLVWTAGSWAPYQENMILYGDSAIVRGGPERPVVLWDHEYRKANTPGDRSRVFLRLESNDLGALIFDGRMGFVDFRRIQVVRGENRVADAQSKKIVNGEESFAPGTPRSFVLVGIDGSVADPIDYSQISWEGNTNAQISVTLTSTASAFDLTLATSATGTPTTQFDVLYRGTKVQTLQAAIGDSVAFYRALVVGNWNQTWYYNGKNGYAEIGYPNGTFGQEDKYVLNADGTGRLLSSRYMDGSVYDCVESCSLIWLVSASTVDGKTRYVLSTGRMLGGRLDYPLQPLRTDDVAGIYYVITQKQ